jgi:hypothetical protein
MNMYGLSPRTFARIALPFIAGTLLLEGCSPGVGAAAAAGNRTSFSAVINGKPIKGDRVMMLGTNSASITPDGSEVHEVIFSLAPTSSDEAANPELSLRFNFPVKPGTYQLTGTDMAFCNNCGVVLSQNVSPFAQYTPQRMAVSITSLTDDRIIGTFSGTLEFSFQTPDTVRKLAPPLMRVENGQFDIPIVRQ